MGTDQQMEEVLEQARAWIGALEVGEGIHWRNLTVFPLRKKVGDGPAAGDDRPPRYRLLSEAIENGEAVVEEVDELGEVPTLKVTNDGSIPMLIAEGEVLIGAKQDRVVNLTTLVPAKRERKVAVSCVERGRWDERSRHFEARGWAHHKLRGIKVESVHYCRAVGGPAQSDQGAVWDEVSDHLEVLHASSPTDSMMDSFEAAEARLEEYREHFDLPLDACGAVVARGEMVVGVDCFDSPETFTKLSKRLADAYFIEAARERRELPATSRHLAESFLDKVAAGLRPAPHKPELGWELEVAGKGLAGAAMWYDGALCHLAAFDRYADGSN